MGDRPPIMKNFLRALRYVWPYRRRLVLSIVCALLAAALWGLNFLAIYPVLKLLASAQTPQVWVVEQVKETRGQIKGWEDESEKLARDLQELDAMPPSKDRDKLHRDKQGKQLSLQRKLERANRDVWWLLVAKKYIDAYLPNDCFQTLAWVFGLVIIVVAVKGCFEFWQEVLVGSVINLSLFDLRNRFYRNSIHLDVDQFGEQGASELMARFTNDTELLGTGMKTLFGKLIAEPLRAISCMILACWISWQLTLMFLVLVPIALYVFTKVGRTMKRATRRLLERMSSIYKILQESFQGVRVVKAFTMEPYERRRFFTATKDYYHKSMLVVKIDALAGPIIELLGVIAVAGALLAGAYLVLGPNTHLFGLQMTNYQMDAATLLQLYALLAAIADPVRKLSSVYPKLQSGAAAADRIFSFIDRRPRVQRNTDGPRLERHRSSIEYRGVCFSYEPGTPILTNVSLSLRHGETVALVGKNGSGKTTLVGLLPRFYDPDHGSIFVDGHDIRVLNLRSLRQQIGLVTQDSILFDDTIYNNIAYGNRHAHAKDVEAAAMKAFAHEFIAKLPHAYQTRIGEAGSRLSGGQKQRIALARAILRDPSILILDEFTSQYDAESEALIHRALKEFLQDRTTIVITHRRNTLEIADRIIMLDDGCICAVGTHEQMLESCGPYQRLFEAQFLRKSA
jgi:ATP-binding cassette subfamily B protein/subfamily B ATP-binding cassette protein MsbA